MLLGVFIHPGICFLHEGCNQGLLFDSCLRQSHTFFIFSPLLPGDSLVSAAPKASHPLYQTLCLKTVAFKIEGFISYPCCQAWLWHPRGKRCSMVLYICRRAEVRVLVLLLGPVAAGMDPMGAVCEQH